MWLNFGRLSLKADCRYVGSYQEGSLAGVLLADTSIAPLRAPRPSEFRIVTQAGTLVSTGSFDTAEKFGWSDDSNALLFGWGTRPRDKPALYLKSRRGRPSYSPFRNVQTTSDRMIDVPTGIPTPSAFPRFIPIPLRH